MASIWPLLCAGLICCMFCVSVYTYLHTELCSGLYIQTQIIDTPGLIPGFNLSESLGLKSELTITDIYRWLEAIIAVIFNQNADATPGPFWTSIYSECDVIYSDCSKNKSLWITLHLEEVINLNEFLNVSQVRGPSSGLSSNHEQLHWFLSTPPQPSQKSSY